MNLLRTSKVNKISNSLWVTIPTAYCKIFGLKKGDRFNVFVNKGGDLILKRVVDNGK